MSGVERERLVRRGIRLSYATIGYNSLEAIASLVAGIFAGSVALIGFGIDSVIEVTASGAAQWRLRSDVDEAGRARAEKRTLLLVGVCFLALALYVVIDGGKALWLREAPERSPAGVIILAFSVVIMPILARAKRHVADQLASGALRSEAKQTSLCAYLSVIALGGVVLNMMFGWWWADPVAALAMTPIILREGVEAIRGDHCEGDCDQL